MDDAVVCKVIRSPSIRYDVFHIVIDRADEDTINMPDILGYCRRNVGDRKSVVRPRVYANASSKICVFRLKITGFVVDVSYLEANCLGARSNASSDDLESFRNKEDTQHTNSKITDLAIGCTGAEHRQLVLSNIEKTVVDGVLVHTISIIDQFEPVICFAVTDGDAAAATVAVFFFATGLRPRSSVLVL